MIEEAQERRGTEDELREAIAQRQLEVHYQPIVNTVSLAIEGYEGLVRWRHPEKGLMPPLKFIPIAETTGLIQAIGQQMLYEACRQMMTGPDHLYVSVNISPTLSSLPAPQMRWVPVPGPRRSTATAGAAWPSTATPP